MDYKNKLTLIVGLSMTGRTTLVNNIRSLIDCENNYSYDTYSGDPSHEVQGFLMDRCIDSSTECVLVLDDAHANATKLVDIYLQTMEDSTLTVIVAINPVTAMLNQTLLTANANNIIFTDKKSFTDYLGNTAGDMFDLVYSFVRLTNDKLHRSL